jgi:oligoendopeptidase F
VARRQGQAVRRDPDARLVQGQAHGLAAALADALDRIYNASQELGRLYSYASLLADRGHAHQRQPGHAAGDGAVAAAFSAATSYVDPEILKAGKATIDKYVAANRGCSRTGCASTTSSGVRPTRCPTARRSCWPTRCRWRAAPATSTASSPTPISRIRPSRCPTASRYGSTRPAIQAPRAVPNRADREKVMSTYFKAIGGFSGTFGTTMNAEAQKVLFYAKARRYATALESELDWPNIPVSVYSRLVEGVNRNLASFHRYLSLRKRMMGVSELHYYDLYAPLVASVKLEYTPEEAQKIVLEAVAPLGRDYGGDHPAGLCRPLDRSAAERRQALGRLFERRLRRPPVHADQLQRAVQRRQHPGARARPHDAELPVGQGAARIRPAGLSDLRRRVASTFNEALLNDYLLKQIKDDDARLSILGGYLENIKGTVFRQTQFAEFELRLHQMAQNGQPITGEALAKLYLDITRRYYGHDKGVTVVDDYIAHEWSVIPHFYADFYVFQYATSFTASEALAAKVKSG